MSTHTLIRTSSAAVHQAMVEHATLVGAHRRATKLQRNRHADPFVQVDQREVHVDRLGVEIVELNVLDQDVPLGLPNTELDHVCTVFQQLVQVVGGHGHVLRFLSVPVDNGRQLALATKPPGPAGAVNLSRLRGKGCNL